MEASVLEFQQTKPPCVAVTLLLQAQKVAVGGINVGPHQHGLPVLKNLVVGANANRSQRLLMIVLAGLRRRALEESTSWTLPTEIG